MWRRLSAQNYADNALQRRGGIVGLRRWSPSKPFDVSIALSVAGTRADLERPGAGNTSFSRRHDE
jgi:hypothetical protein